MMYAAAKWDGGLQQVAKPWGEKAEAQQRVDELNAAENGDQWYLAYYNHAMESWERVLSPEEYEAAKNHAQQMQAAAASFLAQYGVPA